MNCSKCGSLMKYERDNINKRETYTCNKCGSRFIRQYLSGKLTFSGGLRKVASLAYFREKPYIGFIIVGCSLISYFVPFLTKSFLGLLIPIACIALSLITIALRETAYVDREISP